MADPIRTPLAVGKPGGFSLVEALMAVGVSVVFLTTVTSAWYFSTKTFKEENVRNELRFDLHKAMEKLKEDVRLSDGNGILFYPAGSSTYTAISLPKATAAASGLYTVGSSSITWDSTVIYHLYDNSGTQELRRTFFNTFLSSSASRQSQLDTVVGAGGDAGATTTVLADADTMAFEITPTSPTFDGYSSSLELSENTSFGSKQLTAGNHLVRFIVQGKNGASSGFKMGFDQLSFTPSGGGQEAEALSVNASSGQGSTAEDMTPYGSDGLWYGNQQLEYQSSAATNYVEFQIYYDQWMESNFSNVTHSYTEVGGTDPVVRVSSRENQSLLSSWKADTQTGAVEADASGVQDKSIRNILSAGSITYGGEMVRFKFKASTAGNLKITEAYFGARSALSPENFSGVPAQLYFGNSTIGPGDSDGVGATGSTGATSIDIPAGHYVWSNWATVTVTNPSATDFLISFAVENDAAKGNETFWDAGSGTHAYLIDGTAKPNGVWISSGATMDPGFTTSTAIHALSDMAVWTSTGTVTSQIYDTKMASPAYGNLTWDTNGTGTFVFRVRSSANSDMSGATAWSAATTYGSSPAMLGTGSSRYVQWQATLAAASPYSSYPEIDNVKITWPGQTAIVDVSGYFTKRPNYGIFSVEVDGETLVNALEITLDMTKEYQGRDNSVSLTEEVKARNTGK